jgi:photosystem II stability/assembly factor-like uncharacterized protein
VRRSRTDEIRRQIEMNLINAQAYKFREGFPMFRTSHRQIVFAFLFLLLLIALPRAASAQTTGSAANAPRAAVDPSNPHAPQIQNLRQTSSEHARPFAFNNAAAQTLASDGAQPLGAGVWTSGGPFGGNILALAVDPRNPQNIYAGLDNGGGVWKSSDGGASWSPLRNGLPPNRYIITLVIDPSNTNTIYAGFYDGVYTSTDGGASWSRASTGFPNYPVYVQRLVIDPSNPQTLYAGVYNTGSTSYGVFKTTNGGANWTLASSGLPQTDVNVLAIDPQNPQTLYVGFYNSGVYKTTNGGASWSAVNNGFPSSNTFIDALAVDPSNSQNVYAGVSGGGVYKTANGGQSWSQTNSGLPNGATPTSIVIDPTNPQRIVIGTFYTGTFVSTNGGQSWSAINSDISSALVQAVALDPSNTQTIYAGTTSGVYKTTNGGASGGYLFNGMRATAITAVVIDPNNSRIVYAGISGGAVQKSTDGGNTWTLVNNGILDFGVFVNDLAIDRSNSQTLYAATRGGVYKTTNGGASWSAVDTGLPTQTPFKLAIDRQNSQNLFVGTLGGGVYRTTNGGASWSAVNSGLPSNAVIIALTVDPTNGQTAYAGLQSGTSIIYKTTNGGASWSASSTGLPTALTGETYYIGFSIVVDPSNSQIVYTAFDNSGVYKSTDGGATWSVLNAGLPAGKNVSAIALNPANTQIIYVGIEDGGVYRSTNGGASWNFTGYGLPAFAYPLSLVVDATGSNVYAGIFGGVWNFQPSSTVTISGRVLDIKGNGVAGVTVNLSGTANASVTTDSNGNYTFSNLPGGGTYTVTPAAISGSAFFPGAYVYRDLVANQTNVNFYIATAPFQIGGRIIDPSTGNGLANIQVNLSGVQAAATRTDANGNYTFSNLIAGGSYIVKPTDPYLTFTPVSQTVTNLSSNQTINFNAAISQGRTIRLPSSNDFNDPSVFQNGTATLPPGATDPNVTVQVVNGQLVITPISNASGLHYNGKVSVDSIDFTNASATIGVAQVAKGGADTLFGIALGGGDFARFMATNSTTGLTPKRIGVGVLDETGATQLVFQIKQNGVLQTFAVPYDPVSQRFWRLRNDQTITQTAPNGSIVFETSPDNATFTEQFRVAVTKPINSVALEIAAGTAQAVSNPGQAAFDNLQLSANSIDNASFFVGQHYRDFFNRQPDIVGLQFWINQILSCGADARCIDVKRQNVSAAYFVSTEFQQTGFLVYKLYKAAYGNIANTPVPVRYNDFLLDLQAIGSGVVVGAPGWEQKLEQNKQTFVGGFVNRATFKAAYPDSLTPAQFVDQLNQNTGNSLTSDQRNQLVAGLQNGTETRASVLRKVAENQTFTNNEFNRAFVLMQYFGYLRRNPDDQPDGNFAGYNFWLNKLNQFNGDYIKSEMVRSFILSSEYRKRFGKA